ncbi:MAG: ATP-binding cassette domain-containing protein [Hyphomicrobiales bacterium]|nr:ATP-binding cassette domain-containing protein [Hyphomicrobiales bacterium]
MLVLERVSKEFRGRRSLFNSGRTVSALRDVSLAVDRGETFGIVGESGSGKTTLTRLILRLDMPTSGRILFEGDDMARLSAAAMRRLRARIQIVFQDPYASLNPRMTVHDIVTEPMLIHRATLGLDQRTRTARAAELLAMVGLAEQHLHRYPHEFSGGQRQRIGIARALATGPAMLLLDEPTSALDVSVQAQVLNLLHGLQQRLGLTYVFISHDLSVVRYICDRLAVVNRGEIVETGQAEDVFRNPANPYTRMLLAAMPDLPSP